MSHPVERQADVAFPLTLQMIEAGARVLADAFDPGPSNAEDIAMEVFQAMWAARARLWRRPLK